MEILETKEEHRSEVVALLRENQLPSSDLPLSLADFYSVFDENKLVGFIGMERYGPYALLRSMVVHPGYRNRQIAGTLVNTLESRARIAGVETMYLLTETADNYFSRKGYLAIKREQVPAELSRSSEFSHVCPRSAIVMKKDLSEVERLRG